MHGLVDMPPRSSDHHPLPLPLFGRRRSVGGVSVIGGGGSVPGRCGSRLDSGAVTNGAEASLWSATTATATAVCCCFKGAIDVVGVPAVICTEEGIIVLPIVTQYCSIEDSSVVTVTATSVTEVTIAVVGEVVRVRGLSDNPRSVAVPNRGYDGLESRLEALHQTLHMLKLHLHRTDIDVLTSAAAATAVTCDSSCRGRDSGRGSMYS